MPLSWNPTIYARYADERGRPFHDLVDRIPTTTPARVVDLGCGPGALTAALATRWPTARITGLDSSPEMIASARTLESPVDFVRADVATWRDPGVDVVISNACLQWVPGHEQLLRTWAEDLPAGGTIAIQVPANFSFPSHRLMRELAGSPRFADRLQGVLRHADAVAEPATYSAILLDAGLHADVWQTDYLHVLSGPDPVLEWVRGTGLRPVLDTLDPHEAGAFEAQYADLLRPAYPSRPDGRTLLPFRRTFAVGHRP